MAEQDSESGIIDNLAKEILLPLKLQVGAKRDKKSLTLLALLSVTWPITAPLATAYALKRRNESNPNPTNILAGIVVGAPYHFIHELRNPEHKYFEIGGRDALEKANDINHRIRFYEDNQKHDGPNTCSGLEVIYSDGVFLQVFPQTTMARKLDLDIDKLVDHIDERGHRWSKPNPRGTRYCLDPDYNPKIILSKVYRDAPFSLRTDPKLKDALDKILELIV